MKKLRLFWIVFRDGQLQCDAETEQMFPDDEAMVQALVTYAAQQSGVRLELPVAALCLSKSLNYPSATGNPEPGTYFILKEVTEMGKYGGLRWELCRTCGSRIDTNLLPMVCPRCSSNLP